MGSSVGSMLAFLVWRMQVQILPVRPSTGRTIHKPNCDKKITMDKLSHGHKNMMDILMTGHKNRVPILSLDITYRTWKLCQRTGGDRRSIWASSVNGMDNLTSA